MMKKLIFCLLTLAGTGALSSCQQDEVANEVIENKGVTIRASLPGDDARSRVVLGDTDGDETQVYWEAGDVITLKVDENTSYTFSITNFVEQQTTAEFTCADVPEIEVGKTYTFTYGSSELQTEQAGTKKALSDYHYMTAKYTATGAIAWEEVNLTFNTQVAIVEITLPDDVTASKVSLYNAADGAKIATTTDGATIRDKVYFAVAPDTYDGVVWAETADNKTYVAMVGENTLEANNLYRISKTMSVVETIPNTNLKKVISNGTLLVYGNGDIPKGHFRGENSVIHAIILKGVNSIGDDVFDNCDALTSVTILASVTSIGDLAFNSCSSLTSVTIPASVTSIGESAFANCLKLASVTIPTNVTSIEDYAFYGCFSLASVTIPEGVTSIGEYAFYGCLSLESVTIPASVTSIGDLAFYGCKAFESVTIPASVSIIGFGAFANCSKLASVTIPEGVTSIGIGAFADCKALTSVIIPASVTGIGNFAFQNCTSLASVTCLAETPPKLGNKVFDGVPTNDCTLYVPSKSVSNYQASDWNYFANIQAIPTSEP